MRNLSKVYLVPISGAIIAMPGLEFSGVSISYLPCFLALFLLPRITQDFPKTIIALFILGFTSLSLEFFFPTSQSFLSGRFRTATNLINTKFAISVQNENLILWLKFSIALLGGVVIATYAYRKSVQSDLVNGFLTGSLISVLYSFFTLKPGEGAFLQSYGLGRTNTTFGMICTFAIGLLFHHKISYSIRTPMLLLFLCGSLVSGSRGAAATAVLSLFFIFIWRQRASKAIWLGWFSLVALLAIQEFSRSFVGIIGVRALTQNQSTLTSSQLRNLLRSQAILDWAHDPLGGVGFSVLTQGHNTYLQTLAAGGILLCLGYVLTDIQSLVLSIRIQSVPGNGYILGLVSCAIFNHFTQNQIDVPFLYLVLGIILVETSTQMKRMHRQ
jgi:hypothetical protein